MAQPLRTSDSFHTAPIFSKTKIDQNRDQRLPNQKKGTGWSFYGQNQATGVAYVKKSKRDLYRSRFRQSAEMRHVRVTKTHYRVATAIESRQNFTCLFLATRRSLFS
jgi:hypothetical protein